MARSFWERYNHYDPSEGFGSADEWAKAAEALSEKIRGSKHRRGKNKKSHNTLNQDIANSSMANLADLELLYLDKMPDTFEGLKRAFRNALFVVHPDYGGTDSQCRAAMEAMARLAQQYD